MAPTLVFLSGESQGQGSLVGFCLWGCIELDTTEANQQQQQAMQETQEMWVPSLGQEYPLEKGMATHCSILSWKTPWIEGTGRLQSMGLQRIRHDCICIQAKHQLGLKLDYTSRVGIMLVFCMTLCTLCIQQAHSRHLRH